MTCFRRHGRNIVKMKGVHHYVLITMIDIKVVELNMRSLGMMNHSTKVAASEFWYKA